MKVLVIGRTEILYETIFELTKIHKIVGIISAKASGADTKNEKDFEELSKKLGIPFFLTSKVTDDINDFIKSVKPDIGVSMNWVGIIKESTINLIPQGILNAHFADLPRFRGNAVVNWAIILNEKFIPLTIHYMDAGELDSGDILMQHKIPVKESTTVKDIYDIALKEVPQMFKTVLKKIEDGKIKAVPQSKTRKKGFRCYPRLPKDSRIDWKLGAPAIDAIVRASTKPFSGAYTYIKNQDGEIKKLYIWKSRIVQKSTKDIGNPSHIIKNDPSSGESWIYTGGGILALNSVSYQDGKIFEPGKVWKSIRMSFDIDVEDELITIKDQINKINKTLGIS